MMTLARNVPKNRLARIAGVSPALPLGDWPAGAGLLGEGMMPS